MGSLDLEISPDGRYALTANMDIRYVCGSCRDDSRSRGGAGNDHLRNVMTLGFLPNWQVPWTQPAAAVFARVMAISVGRSTELMCQAVLAEHERAAVRRTMKTLTGAIDQAGHLPIGQSSWSIPLFTLVKQPQILQRRPVWCSQAAQVSSRFR